MPDYFYNNGCIIFNSIITAKIICPANRTIPLYNIIGNIL